MWGYRKILQQACLSMAIMAFLSLATPASTQPTKAFAPTDEQFPIQMRFEGYLRAKGTDKWLIGDISLFVDSQTQIVDKRAPAEIGAWLIVWATELPDESLHAELIYVDRPAGQAGQLQFTNILNKKAQDWLVVGETLVLISQETAIVGDPEVGDLLWVCAEQQGSYLQGLAIEVIAKKLTASSVEFEGTIEEIGDPIWRIANQQVVVDETTKVIGEWVVGRHAEVVAHTRPDGQLKAEIIRILDQPAEITLGALVAAILPQETGTQLWDMILFAPQESAYPKPGFVYVHRNTLVDESRAIAQPGQWAEVTGMAIGQDTYQADLIRVEHPVPVTVSGEVEQRPNSSSSRGWWRIDGHMVWVADTARVSVDPQARNQASVRGVLLGNGVVWAGPLQATED